MHGFLLHHANDGAVIQSVSWGKRIIYLISSYTEANININVLKQMMPFYYYCCCI